MLLKQCATMGFDRPTGLQEFWFYHFVDTHAGARVWQCELSTIDTALLRASVLTAQQYFAPDTDIRLAMARIFEPAGA
jgi:hypothetical protein